MALQKKIPFNIRHFLNTQAEVMRTQLGIKMQKDLLSKHIEEKENLLTDIKLLTSSNFEESRDSSKFELWKRIKILEINIWETTFLLNELQKRLSVLYETIKNTNLNNSETPINRFIKFIENIITILEENRDVLDKNCFDVVREIITLVTEWDKLSHKLIICMQKAYKIAPEWEIWQEQILLPTWKEYQEKITIVPTWEAWRTWEILQSQQVMQNWPAIAIMIIHEYDAFIVQTKQAEQMVVSQFMKLQEPVNI